MKTMLILILAAASLPAMATEQFTDGQSTNLFNAAAACFPALPVFDGNVRKRPLAVVNEGNRASFVTCGYIVDQEASDKDGGVERFDIVAKNQGQSSATVTCTAVVGVDDGNARYILKAVTLAPGQRKRMEWKAVDYGLPEGWEGPVNLSCLLPVMTALNEGSVHWHYADRY